MLQENFKIFFTEVRYLFASIVFLILTGNLLYSYIPNSKNWFRLNVVYLTQIPDFDRYNVRYF